MIQEYKVKEINVVDNNLIDFFAECLKNIAKSMVELNLLHRFYDAPKILVNCAMLLTYMKFSETQGNIIAETINTLLNNEEFVKFFFSTDYPDREISLKVLNDLLACIHVDENFEIVKRIINNKNFEGYYINSSTYSISNFFAHFIDKDKSECTQNQIHEFITSFEGKDRIHTLRLLRKHLDLQDIITAQKEFITQNFDELDSEDIIDFAFNGWLEISEEDSNKILNRAIALYKSRVPGMRSYPDPLEEQLELICLLYITEQIDGIDAIKELADKNVFLQFFLDDKTFDYSIVDFSNYMWQNIARQPRFMNIFKEHKNDIIPTIKRKIELGAECDFERRLLYGTFLSDEELLEF